MKPTKAKQLSRIQHLVPNNPQADQQLTSGSDWDQKVIAREKKKTLYDSAYKTASGHWKRRDEPDEAEQLRHRTASANTSWQSNNRHPETA